MPTKMKSYRLPDWALNNIQYLRENNPDMTDTDIIAYSLSLAVQVSDSWKYLPNYSETGDFQLNDDRQAVELSQLLWGLK